MIIKIKLEHFNWIVWQLVNIINENKSHFVCFQGPLDSIILAKWVKT